MEAGMLLAGFLNLCTGSLVHFGRSQTCKFVELTAPACSPAACA